MKQNKKTGEELTELDGLDTVGTQTLLALIQSKTHQEAADKLSITRGGLWLRVKKYKLDEIIAQFPRQALMRLQLSSIKAAEVLNEEMEKTGFNSKRLEAAKDVLDRVGVTGDKPTTLQQFNVNGEMTLEFE